MSKHTSAPLQPILDPANPVFLTDSSILEIHPTNDEAELAFDDLAKAMNQKKVHPHHAHYIVVTGKKDLSESYISSGTDYSSDDQKTRPSGLITTGHFRINFTAEPVARTSMWSMGRGTGKSQSSFEAGALSDRKVDVLLANIRSKYAKGLHSAHANIRMHPESGVWLLSVSSQCEAIRSEGNIGRPLDIEKCPHYPLHLNGKPIRHSEEHCLSEARFALQIAHLSYRVNFNIAFAHQEDSYIHKRNVFLAAMNLPIPQSLISGIPFAHDHRNQLARWRDPYSRGAFGTVYLGFDPDKGGLRAIKAWNCKRDTEASAVLDEIFVSLFLSDTKSDGIIRTFGWRNTVGEEAIRQPPIDYYLVMESGTDFRSLPWSRDERSIDWHERKVLFRQLLLGLESIHSQGWIHRDVTAQNIIYISPLEGQRPARAKLADFGKLCKTPTHTNPHLAAKQFRAPEVDGKQTYDQRIDIWGLGLAVAYSWFTHEREDMNKEQHASILSLLSQKAQLTDLASLLEQIWQRTLSTDLLRPSVYNILL